MSELYESRHIVGKSVMDNGTKVIGKVKDIIININGWQVECLLVKIPRQVCKELEIPGIMGATARVKPDDLDQIGDMVRLNVPATDIARMVEHD